MGEENHGVDTAVMDHTQRLHIIVQCMSDDDSLGVDESVQRLADRGQGEHRRGIILCGDAGEASVEVSVGGRAAYDEMHDQCGIEMCKRLT